MMLQFEAHTLIFGVKFQKRLQNFAHTSVTLKTQTEKLSLRGQEELQKNLEFIFPLYYVFFSLKVKTSVRLNKTEREHAVKRRKFADDKSTDQENCR
jgi:hypothetical protein